MKRMDRYKDATNDIRESRSDNNKELYESLGSTTRYTNFTDVTTANAIDLTSTKNYNTREGYHQMKEYQEVIPTPKVKKDLEDFKAVYNNRENKIYDINNVLEEARKNRIEKDELEEKRKLKNASYNILASLNPEELEKYRKEKQERKLHHDEDDLKELIDTITSATLAGDIKVASELLSDLMATSIMEKINADLDDEDDAEETVTNNQEKENNQNDEQENYKLTLSKEILDLKELKKLTDKIEKSQLEETKENQTTDNADEEFYTRSMDLSDQDFELEEEFKDKKLPLAMKILIFLIILVILAAVFFFLWKII